MRCINNVCLLAEKGVALIDHVLNNLGPSTPILHSERTVRIKSSYRRILIGVRVSVTVLLMELADVVILSIRGSM